jgi:hypothetical protein
MTRLRPLTSIAFLFFASFIFMPNASARDMQGRLGLGYNAQFSNINMTNGVPGISIKYALTRDVSFEGIIGITTASPGNTVTAVKLMRNLFLETNLNFYTMLGGGILSAENRSGVEFLGGFGAEFFIPGVESLGFSMETGGSFTNISGSFALQTIGASFLNAGIHFYF